MLDKSLKKSIIHIADFNAHYSGNFVQSLVSLNKSVDEHLDMNLVVVLPVEAQERPWGELLEKNNIRISFINKQQPIWKRVARLLKIARETRAVVLHSHFTTFDLDVVLVRFFKNIRAVWHMHSPMFEPYRFKQKIKDLIKMRLFARFLLTRLIAVSDSIAKEAVQRGCPARKIKTIHNGIDLNRLAINGQRRQTLRDLRGIAEDERLFLLFAWDPYIKGMDILTQAIELTNGASQKLKCLIVASSKNPECATASNEHSTLEIIPPVENVAELYEMADCFVSASRFEGFPYSISEAMACGLPVIASDIDSISFYKNKNLGFFTFESGDAVGLSVLIKKLSNKSLESLESMGAVNQKFATQHLSMQRWCDELVSTYRLVVKKDG